MGQTDEDDGTVKIVSNLDGGLWPKYMTDEHFMNLALDQAKLAKQNREWPFGAVIVKDGKVIAQNRRAETAEKNVLAHAELQAVNDACRALGSNNLSDCVIYTSNEPCLMCAAAIFQAKIPRVVIALSREDLPHLLRERKLRIEDVAADSGYKIEIIRGVSKDKAMELFNDIKKI
jgi:tRNA(Arg) A34 adenosine deaminase TadA